MNHMNSVINRLKNRETKVSVVGQGYVGLPLTLAFAKCYSVVAFDIDDRRIAMLKGKEDPSGEMKCEAFDGLDVEFTTDSNKLKEASFHVVAVPTPIDGHNKPDLCLLEMASDTIGKIIKKGDTVVFESTVYPGCTEEVCIPIIEANSGLKCNEDFGVGYSPERINPGDTKHSLSSVIKVVSGSNEKTRDLVAQVYGEIVKAGVHIAPSIKVAEAAKIIENTQRDVNIALINELSIIFSKMGIDTRDVLEAAKTKWNFLPFEPGLVGGHCIGVDPYYLDYKASELGYHTQIINKGRFVNDSMGRYVAKVTTKLMLQNGFAFNESRVLVLGLTYKENVKDVRNSKTVDIIDELKSFGITKIDIVDPIANSYDAKKLYGIDINDKVEGEYSAIIITVVHDHFKDILTQEFFDMHLMKNGIVADVKGYCKDKIRDINMWRL